MGLKQPVRSDSLETASHGLRSLWDIVLKQAALDLGRATANLAHLQTACESSRRLRPEILQDSTGHLQASCAATLDDLRRVCILANLDNLLPEITRFQGSLSPEILIEDIKGLSAALKHHLIDNLQNEWYFQVEQSDVRYYGKKELFGPQVASKFKEATYDIENAGNCVALQQPTACVFHLMRAMEVALRNLCRRLNHSVGPKDTLGKILNDITPKLNAMPDRTEAQKLKKERWAEARVNLFHVKQAWRDNSMHGKRIYDREHAFAIFRAVGTFMSHLASL